jgi:tripartite-type tricarboxylate transporter receptor subunit TctC
LCADKLRGIYAPAVIVDNRPGAGARIALEHVKGSEADGSVTVLTPSSMLVIYPHVYKKLAYDPVRDFAPVSTAAQVEFAFSVGPAVPENVKTLPDFAKWAKANPQQAAFSSPAAGSTPHFLGVMFGRAAGIQLTHVPYKGDAPGIQDLIGGQIASSVNVIGSILPHAKGGGKARLLATSGAKRSRFLPEVPTFVEAGYKDVEAQEWFGFLVPAKTPPEIVDKFAAAVAEVVKKPEVAERLAQLAYEPTAIRTQEFAALLSAERDRWGPIVKASGFQLEE